MSKISYNSKTDSRSFSPEPKLYKLQRIDFSVIKNYKGTLNSSDSINLSLKSNATKECISLKKYQSNKSYFKIITFKQGESNKTWSVLLLDFYAS